MALFSDIWSKLVNGRAAPVVAAGKGQTRTVARGARPSMTARMALDEAVAFHFPASEVMIGSASNEALLRAIKAFAPSQPILEIGEFAGRRKLLEQIITAIEEHRNHLVIYGGRGTGKTSIAMALVSVARQVGYHCAYISCSRESSVDSIFRSALAELPIRFDTHFDPRREDADPSGTFAQLLPDQRMTPQGLSDILTRVTGTRMLIVIDEYDRNESPTLSQDLTEVMKVLSDLAASVQVVIVGVGDVIDNLVGEHASVARVLYGVRVEAMSKGEIEDTLAVASRHAGVELGTDVVDGIVAIAHGRPYIARLAGLKATKMALKRGSGIVELVDFNEGTEELLGYLAAAGFGHVDRFISASPENALVSSAVLRTKRDASDQFTVADVRDALPKQPLGRDLTAVIQRVVDGLASPENGVLSLVPGTPARYHFVDPRAELCVSILCSRAVARTAAGVRAPEATAAAS